MTSPEPTVDAAQPDTRSVPDPPRRTNGFLNLRDLVALSFVAGLPLLVYWRAALGLGMFYFGDIARFFYPTRVLYAGALAAGRLPQWQPEILTGIPLLAEMQTGALYPPHLALYRLLPVDLALNYDILLHLAFLAAGTFVFARLAGRSRVAAVVAALALALGGFGTARITHPNVLDVAAWLPWLLALCHLWRVRWHPAVTWVLLVLASTMQWLGGHPQFALINVLTAGSYVLATALLAGRAPSAVPQLTAGVPLRRVSAISALAARAAPLVPLVALALGTLGAAAQLLPTYEFSLESARAGGVDPSFFTTFSYHPLYLALLADPFLRGNPYPNTSVEVIAYIGLLPLILAGVAIILKRDRQTMLWAAFAVVALVLAFGGNTPLYPALRALPLFNLFRVPARFLFVFAFALVMLSGIGLDALRARAFYTMLLRRSVLTAVVAAGLVLVLIGLIPVLPVEAWLDAWRGLPVIFGGLALLLVLGSARFDRTFVAVGTVALTLLDVICFGAVYAPSYNAIAPRAEVFPRPRVLDMLDLSGGARVLTSESVLPWTSVMNASLYTNLNAAHGVSAAAGYTPLVPRQIADYLSNLSPVMLNKLGVRYYLIPQLLPVDSATEAADVYDPFLVDPLRAPLEFSPVDADSVEIESSLAQSVNLPTGAIVADIVLTDESGAQYRLPLRAGLETAEWAYDRSDVLEVVRHARPPVASSFPARSAFPIEEHTGHTYRGRINFTNTPVPIIRLQVIPTADGNLIHIQSVALVNGDARIDLAPLLGKATHHLIYRSEDVAVYENPDAAPRAFITHNVRRADDEEAFRQLRSPFPNAEIYVAEGEDSETDVGQGTEERADLVLSDPERVVISARADADGYLVLTDAWAPGWVALVDGVPAPMTRADVIFRAVPIPAGPHFVEFLYRPLSFYIGLGLSGIAVALLVISLLAAILVREAVRAPSAALTPP